MKKINLILLAIGLLFIGCKKENEKFKTVTLRQEWFANASYLGEIMAVNETDTLYGLNIELIEGAEDIDPIKMIISGQDTFGVVAAERIFSANEKGADLVVIGVVNHINPTCFISLKSTPLNSPKDFENKKVGVFTGNNTELVYRTLMFRAGIDEDRIEEIEAPFDLNTFISGVYDIRPAYIFDEPISLENQKIEFNILKPQDYGVKFIGNVYFTERSTIEENPELVQNFVNAIAKGWELTYENPKKAAEYLGKFSSSIDPERELKSFLKGKEYFRNEDNQVLESNEKNWKQMGDDLVHLGIIKKNNFETFFDNSFILNYYSKND